MNKLLLFFGFVIVTGACSAQHYAERFNKDKITCLENESGDYIQLVDILPGLYDLYIKSDICSLVAGQTEPGIVVAGFLNEDILLKVKKDYFILPVRLNYHNTLPVSYYLPDIESGLIVIVFEVVSHTGLTWYNYMLLDFNADGKIYCFEADSKVKLDEEKIITKYNIAGIVGVIPTAEKMVNK